MGVDCAGPVGWATLFHGLDCGDPHRVGVFSFQRRHPGHQNCVVSDGTRQAGDSFLSGRDTGLPEIPECGSRFTGESEGGTSPGLRLALTRERRRSNGQEQRGEPPG